MVDGAVVWFRPSGTPSAVIFVIALCNAFNAVQQFHPRLVLVLTSDPRHCILAGSFTIAITRLLLSPRADAECGERNRSLLEGIEKEDAGDDGRKAGKHAEVVFSAHLTPFLEQNRRRNDNESGEKHIEDRCHHRGVENVQRFVQVVHLDSNKAEHQQSHHPGQPVAGLVVSTYRLLDRHTDSLTAHHRQRADRARHSDVDERIRVTPTASQYEDERKVEQHDERRISDKACGEEEGRKGKWMTKLRQQVRIDNPPQSSSTTS